MTIVIDPYSVLDTTISEINVLMDEHVFGFPLTRILRRSIAHRPDVHWELVIYYMISISSS